MTIRPPPRFRISGFFENRRSRGGGISQSEVGGDMYERPNLSGKMPPRALRNPSLERQSANIISFSRLKVGEGIEVEAKDFATAADETMTPNNARVEMVNVGGQRVMKIGTGPWLKMNCTKRHCQWP